MDQTRDGAETGVSRLISSLPQPLQAPRAMAPDAFRDDTQLTQKWLHQPFFGTTTMAVHVVGTVYSGRCAILNHAAGREGTLKVMPGSITISPEGYTGIWEVEHPHETSQVYVSQQRLESCSESIGGGGRVELLTRVGADDATTHQLLDVLSREVAHYDGSSSLFIEQTLDVFCTHIVRRHCSVGKTITNAHPRGLAAWQVRRVLRFMQDHLHEPVGLAELAAHIGMSRFHFCTAFHLAVGQTPHSALTHLRMQRAHDLLSHSNESITAIAGTVGYDSPSAFAARFRRTMGCTPSEARRRR